MIITLNKQEMAALTLHMYIMRKNVRKGFKKNHGSSAATVLASYDDVKNTTAHALENMSENDEIFTFHYNINEINMLHSFLSFYLVEIEKEFSNADLNEEDRLQIDYLSSIKDKVDLLKVA